MAHLADDDDLSPEAADSTRIGITNLAIARVALKTDRFQLDVLAAKFRKLKELSIVGDFAVETNPSNAFTYALASWSLKNVTTTLSVTLDRICEILKSHGFVVVRVSPVEANFSRA